MACSHSTLILSSSLPLFLSSSLQSDNRFEVTTDVKSQLKFLSDLDRLEKERQDEQERERLLKAAKSRSKMEDPEQARLKQKAKDMQLQEAEHRRQIEANETALAAIGPRKKKTKLDEEVRGTALALRCARAYASLSVNFLSGLKGLRVEKFGIIAFARRFG